MRHVRRCVRLLHITTVPESLAFLKGQIRHFKEYGFHVDIASSPGNALVEFAESEGVKAFGIPISRAIAPIRDLVSVFRLWRMMRRARPVMVHAHFPKGGLLGMVAAWLARVPIRIYHVRGLRYASSKGLKRRLLQWTEIASCALAHQVLCVSHSVRGEAIAHGICRSTKIKALHHGSGNGVDAAGYYHPSRLHSDAAGQVRARFHIPQDALVAGFVGRIVRDKGWIELARAWTQLREEFANLHLLVVGPFEQHDPVPEDVTRLLRTDSRIHLAGFEKDMPQLYSAMDVVVLPTYREGFPNVLLEAAAMERPVVATAVSGCLDAVVDGVTGTLVPLRDPSRLAAAISRYLQHPALRRQHGSAGRVRVLRDFRPELIWNAVLQEYQRLLRQRGLSLPVSVDEVDASHRKAA